MTEFIQALKQYLKENQNKFNEHWSWLGDTESGFYSEDVFDFEKLCAEIDEFSKQFKDES